MRWGKGISPVENDVCAATRRECDLDTLDHMAALAKGLIGKTLPRRLLDPDPHGVPTPAISMQLHRT